MKPFILRDEILIHAPIERCFALSTSLAVVQLELGMKPVAGRGLSRTSSRTTGLVTGGDTIRWQGWQLGFPNYHVSLIENFEPPLHFRDRMIAGRFRSFEHDHRFEQTSAGVLLRDEVRFTMPLGVAGLLVGGAVLVPHIRGLLQRRFQLLKRLAESDGWRHYLAA